MMDMIFAMEVLMVMMEVIMENKEISLTLEARRKRTKERVSKLFPWIPDLIGNV